ITCVASPGLSGRYWVNVTVDGDPAASASAWSFSYTLSRTPLLRAIRPAAGPPGASTAVIVGTTSALTRDCAPTNWGDSDCLGGVLFGDRLCDLPEGDVAAVVNSAYRSRWGGTTFGLNCTLPAPRANNPLLPSAVPRLGTAAFLNVTPLFEATSRGGALSVAKTAWLYTPDGLPYMYAQYPEVYDISPTAGSTAGGTRVTIRGRGFPNLDPNDLNDLNGLNGNRDTVEVLLGGAPCVVAASSYDTLVCVTSPRPAAGAAATATSAVPLSYSNTVRIGGHYPGMRGAEYEVYPLPSAEAAPGFRGLWRLNTTMRVGDAQYGGTAAVLMDRVEGLDSLAAPDAGAHCSRVKGFFVAPRAASYSFTLVADDYAQLNGTWIENGTEVKRALYNATSWNYIDNWNLNEKPRPLSLAAGQPVLLELNHCNTISRGVLQLGVRASSPDTRPNSIGEAQRLRVTTAHVPRSVAVKLLYGGRTTGSSGTTAVTAVWVSVTVDDASRFTDWRLGLSLVVEGASVTFPLAATTAEIAAAIFGALLGPSDTAAGRAAFGVRKVRQADNRTITIELGADAVVLPTLLISSARLVELPGLLPLPGPPAAAAACKWANPLLAPVAGSAAAEAYGSAASLLALGRRPGPAAPNLTALYATFNLSVQPAPALMDAAAAAVPGGTWQLTVAGGSSTTGTTATMLPYDATPDQVYDAVVSLIGAGRTTADFNPTVTVTAAVREGAYLATIWNITLPDWPVDDSTTLLPLPGPGFPADALLAVEVRRASQLPGGAVRVALGAACEWAEFRILDDPVDVVASRLASLPGLGAPERISRWYSNDTSFNLVFEHDPQTNPGDQPLLRVTDWQALVGPGASATVTTDYAGSNDQFFGPLPVDMMQLAVGAPGSIRLAVNGVPGACAHPSGLCAFGHDAAATPNVTGVSTPLLGFGAAQATAELTILGRGFERGGAGTAGGDGSGSTNSSSSSSSSSAVSVTVGGVGCEVVRSNDTSITCLLPRAVPAGLRPLAVLVPGWGYAAGAPPLLVDGTMSVTALSPPVLAFAGRTIFSVLGEGVDESGGCSALRLSLGGLACAVVACSPTALTVLYPGGVRCGLGALRTRRQAGRV
ncbi:Fibrocystin, partial [Tetrabaena socialis]